MSVPDFLFERWTAKYIPDLVKNADNPRVAETLRNIFPNPYTEEDAVSWIKICSAADESRNFDRAVVIDGRAAGGIGLIIGNDVYSKTAELGYWLGEDFWGQGIMTAAVKEFCRIGFERFDIVRIFAGAFAHNAGSRQVLEKAGFRLEGVQRMNIYKNGKFGDSCMYALLKDEFV